MRLAFAIVLVLAAIVVTGTSSTWGGNPKAEKFSTETGETVDWLFDPGFNEWGYNYNAWMFSGGYCDAYHDASWCQAYKDVDLIMKWSPEWLDRSDSNGDGKLDRGYVDCRGPGTNAALDESHCPGAWITNQMRGWNPDGTRWSWFVKIVYPGQHPVDSNGDGLDDTTGGQIIWNEFVVIESVYNDPAADAHGVEFLVQPPGLGAY